MNGSHMLPGLFTFSQVTKREIRDIRANALKEIEDEFAQFENGLEGLPKPEDMSNESETDNESSSVTRKRNKSLTVLGNTKSILVTGGILTKKEGVLELRRSSAMSKMRKRRSSASIALSAISLMANGAKRGSSSSKRSSIGSRSSSVLGRASRASSRISAALSRAGSKTTRCYCVLEKGNLYFNLNDAVVKSGRHSNDFLAEYVEDKESWEVLPISLIDTIRYDRGKSFVLALGSAPEYGFDEQEIEFRCRSVNEAQIWIEHVLTQVRNQAMLTEEMADMLGRRAQLPSVSPERVDEINQDTEQLFQRAVQLWKIYHGTQHERVAKCLDRFSTWKKSVMDNKDELTDAEIEAESIRRAVQYRTSRDMDESKKKSLTPLDEVRFNTVKLVEAHLEQRKNN